MMIDLHMHSTFSDGTDSVEELLQNVRRSGIAYFSLTDHDTIEGARAMEELVPDDMTFIRGIEFSSITDVGKCHILGYGCDWNNKGFLDLLEEGNVKRRNKLEKRIFFRQVVFQYGRIRLVEQVSLKKQMNMLKSN